MPRRKFNLSWKQGLAEILLIFIGITLAIAFQNYNDDRKDNQLRNGYYERLLVEIKQDVSDLNGVIGYNEIRQKRIIEFFAFLDTNERPNPDQLQQLIQSISYHMSSYVPNENTYKELISTGNIKLIQTDVRQKLLRLSQMHAYVVETERAFDLRYDNRRNQMAEVIDEASFYGQRTNANPRLTQWQRDVNSEGFRRYSNLLAARLSIAETLIEMFNTLKAQCQDLIVSIETLE